MNCDAAAAGSAPLYAYYGNTPVTPAICPPTTRLNRHVDRRIGPFDGNRQRTANLHSVFFTFV